MVGGKGQRKFNMVRGFCGILKDYCLFSTFPIIQTLFSVHFINRDGALSLFFSFFLFHIKNVWHFHRIFIHGNLLVLLFLFFFLLESIFRSFSRVFHGFDRFSDSFLYAFTCDLQKNESWGLGESARVSKIHMFLLCNESQFVFPLLYKVFFAFFLCWY